MSAPEPIPVTHAELAANHEKFGKLCDFTIVVEGKAISCLRCVVERRLPHLASAPPELISKSKVRASHVHMEFRENSLTYDAMVSVLEYMYNGTLDLSRCSLRQVIMILTAGAKLGVNEVVKHCQRRLIAGLTVDTVFPVLKLAHDSQLTDVKALCLQFCMLHYQEVVGKRSGISTIGIELFQEITVEHMKGEEPRPLELPELEEEDLPAMYSEILSSGDHADALATFSETDKTVPFHRAIFAAHSEPMFRYMSQFSGDPKKPAKIQFDGVTEMAFRALAQMIYTGACPVTPVAACSLITHMVVPYELPYVREYCEELARDLTVVNVLTVLEMTYLPINAERRHIARDLRDLCLAFIVQNLPKISMLQIEYLQHNICIDILKAIHAHQKNAGIAGESDTLKSLISPRGTVSVVDVARKKKKRDKDKKGSKSNLDAGDKKKHTKRSKSAADLKHSTIERE